MCRDSTRRGERRNPMRIEPGMRASWKIRSGVGRRKVLMYGAV
jgi:hypothetical protein